MTSKGGMAFDPELARKVIDGRPETLRRQCEASLSRLRTDHLDLYYLHRMDRQVPIEESVGALARLVEEGKIGAIGLSEVSAATLRLDTATVARLDAVLTPDQVAGARYDEALQAEIDTEEFGES